MPRHLLKYIPYRSVLFRTVPYSTIPYRNGTVPYRYCIVRYRTGGKKICETKNVYRCGEIPKCQNNTWCLIWKLHAYKATGSILHITSPHTKTRYIILNLSRFILDSGTCNNMYVLFYVCSYAFYFAWTYSDFILSTKICLRYIYVQVSKYLRKTFIYPRQRKTKNCSMYILLPILAS